MPSASVPVTVAPRIAALVRLLASPADGEALNAARALGRTLSNAGLDFHTLAALVEHPTVSPPTPPYQSDPRPEQGHSFWSTGHRREVRTTLEFGLAHFSFTLWEVEFIANVIERLRDPRGRLTLRQIEVVNRLIAKIEALC